MINEQLLHIDYTDKVVFITGSLKGIGRHLAQAFAENNARVIMTYCQSKESAVEFLSSTDKRSLYKLDVTKPSDIYTLYDKIISNFGKIDVLINNAGACDDNSIWDTES